MKIKLDLTKNRLDMLNKARERIENNEMVAFVYTDVNCRLKIKMTDDCQFFFSDLEQFENVLENL